MLVMLQQKFRVSGLLSLACIVLACLFSAHATAEPRFTNGHRLINFKQVHRHDASLTPTRMMSDEQLYLAADAMRNDRVPAVHLQANRFWLQSQQGDCYEGSAALRKVLTRTLSNMYPSLSYQGEEYTVTTNESEEDSVKESSYAFQRLDNYSLRLSQRRVALKFKYEF